MRKVLAIDPGNVDSAFVLMDGLTPVRFEKVANDVVLRVIQDTAFDPDGPFREDSDPYECPRVAIEMIASYGMAVGKEVFDTCVWIGRFSQAAIAHGLPVDYVYRRDVKLHLCGSSKAKDPNVRQALIDRFAHHDLKNGKGTKGNRDFFYGFSKDIWAAYAVAITYAERGAGG